MLSLGHIPAGHRRPAPATADQLEQAEAGQATPRPDGWEGRQEGDGHVPAGTRVLSILHGPAVRLACRVAPAWVTPNGPHMDRVQRSLHDRMDKILGHARQLNHRGAIGEQPLRLAQMTIEAQLAQVANPMFELGSAAPYRAWAAAQAQLADVEALARRIDAYNSARVGDGVVALHGLDAPYRWPYGIDIPRGLIQVCMSLSLSGLLVTISPFFATATPPSAGHSPWSLWTGGFFWFFGLSSVARFYCPERPAHETSGATASSTSAPRAEHYTSREDLAARICRDMTELCRPFPRLANSH